MSRRIALRLLTALTLVLGVVALQQATTPAHAETGTKALLLDGAGSLEEQRATALGFDVTNVTSSEWAAMTAADFADYQLVILHDNGFSVPQAVAQNSQALSDAVMARAGGNSKVGNRVMIGSDPAGHAGSGGQAYIEAAVEFASVVDGATNLYIATSDVDSDWDGNGTGDLVEHLLPKLTIDPTPDWSENASPPCGGDVSLISNAAQFATLTTATLAGWGCSVHISFPTFPTDWVPLAIATDTPTAPTCGTDVDTGEPACGEAYILIAGSGVVAEAPNLALTPPSETRPVGSQGTVTATVTDPDDAPLANQPVTFLVTGANAGASGTCVPASCASDASGVVTFTYTGANPGDDTINASITLDGSTQTATAAKTWEVGANTAPVAEDQSIVAVSGTPTPVTLVATDADGDTLTYTVVDAPAHGDVTGTGSEVVYTSDPGYEGGDSFTFRASDGTASSNLATVSILVVPPIPQCVEDGLNSLPVGGLLSNVLHNLEPGLRPLAEALLTNFIHSLNCQLVVPVEGVVDAIIDGLLNTIPDPPAPRPAAGDFNGDGRTDISVFRPSNGRWYTHGVAGSVQFGATGDAPVAGDFDGDGRDDLAVFRPSSGRWYIEGVAGSIQWGTNGDVPVPGDYDGDGADDIAVFRPATGRWYFLGGSTVAFGTSGDIPVPADYDGDGDTDVAVYRPSSGRWFLLGGFGSVQHGASSDIPVPGDYDGNGTDDVAVFRPSTGRWHVLGAAAPTHWGTAGDIPQPGDYAGDDATERAVYRPSTGRWYVHGTAGSTQWGAAGDIPVVLPWAIYRTT